VKANKLAGQIPAKRTYPNDGAKCGTYSKYSHGCRCEFCRSAQRAYYALNRAAYIAAAMRRYHRTHPATVVATTTTPVPDVELTPLDPIAVRGGVHEFIRRLDRIAWDNK
jgi:hypothetical protein